MQRGRIKGRQVDILLSELFAFSHLSFSGESDRMTKGYQRLYAYASEHPEAAEIFAAID